MDRTPSARAPRSNALLLLAWAVCGFGGCASAPPEPAVTAVAPRTAPPPRAKAQGEQLGPHALPELPPAEERGEQLARALDQARAVFANPAPRPRGEDAAQLDAWLRGELAQWMQAAIEQLDAMKATLARIGESRPSDRVIGIALYGLSLARFADQVAGLPLPSSLAGDPDLEGIYRLGLWHAAAPALLKAVQAFEACRAGELPEWKAMCEQHLAVTNERLREAEREVAETERAQILRTQGPRPPGSDACWEPAVGRGPPPPAREPGAPPVPAVVELDLADPARVPLLDAERRALRAALQRALSGRYAAEQLRVAWLGEAERRALIAQWASGRQLRGGPRCARGVEERLDFFRRSLPKLEIANAWVTCQTAGDCQLQVDLGRGGVAAALGYQRLQAPIALPLSDLEGWLAAASSLEPLTGSDRASALIGRPRRPPGAPLTLHEVATHGAWDGAVDAASAALEGAQERLVRCASSDADPTRELHAVLDVAEQGAVVQVWQPPALDAHRTQQRCVAGALRALALPPGQGKRRLSARFSLGLGQSASARDYAYGPLDLASGVRVSVASEDNPELSPAPLSGAAALARTAACLSQAPELTDTIELETELTVSATGQTRRVELGEVAGGTPAPGEAVQRCLQEALRQTRFECTRSGKPTAVRARLCLRREPQ